MAKSAHGGHSPSDVARELKGIDFPASKADLVNHVEGGSTNEDAVGIIKQMPERTYESMADVMKGVGEVE